jgi:hypothetical protein
MVKAEIVPQLVLKDAPKYSTATPAQATGWTGPEPISNVSVLNLS